jgi:hypothetical protein
VDQLLHGSAHMRGWGQPTLPDPTLLTVRGFDPTAGRFKYEVNPRFGDTRLSSTGIRAPFLVTLEVRMRLGRPGIQQNIDQMLAPGRSRGGERRTVQQVKDRLLNSVYNPVRGLVQAKDSLSVLTTAQVEQLTLLERRITAQQDSIARPLAQYLAALPTAYDQLEVVRRVQAGRLALFDTVVEGMRQAGTIFTSQQIDEFPPALKIAFNIERLNAARPGADFFWNW